MDMEAFDAAINNLNDVLDEAYALDRKIKLRKRIVRAAATGMLLGGVALIIDTQFHKK